MDGRQPRPLQAARSLGDPILDLIARPLRPITCSSAHDDLPPARVRVQGYLRWRHRPRPCSCPHSMWRWQRSSLRGGGPARPVRVRAAVGPPGEPAIAPAADVRHAPVSPDLRPAVVRVREVQAQVHVRAGNRADGSTKGRRRPYPSRVSRVLTGSARASWVRVRAVGLVAEEGVARAADVGGRRCARPGCEAGRVLRNRRGGPAHRIPTRTSSGSVRRRGRRVARGIHRTSVWVYKMQAGHEGVDGCVAWRCSVEARRCG